MFVTDGETAIVPKTIYFVIVFFWACTLWMGIFGRLGVDRSGIFIERSRSPILFWIIYGLFVVVVSLVTLQMLTTKW